MSCTQLSMAVSVLADDASRFAVGWRGAVSNAMAGHPQHTEGGDVRTLLSNYSLIALLCHWYGFETQKLSDQHLYTSSQRPHYPYSYYVKQNGIVHILQDHQRFVPTAAVIVR
jgi:hypothetical protein